MPDLNQLAQERSTILLAELAGLLHNIGKLDPNFLNIPGDVREAHPEYIIPDYHFKRFSSPDEDDLLRAEDEITDRKWANRGQSDFRIALLDDSYWDTSDLAGIHALKQDWNAAAEAHPRLVEAIDAAWYISLFLRSNGPLYRSLAAERRREKEQLPEKLEELEHEFERIKQTGTPEEQRSLSELQKRIRVLSRQRSSSWPSQQLLNRESGIQAQLEQEFRQVLLEVAGARWNLANLLTLFWDDFFYKPTDSEGDADYERLYMLSHWVDLDSELLPALLILAHGEVSGPEKSSGITSVPSWEHIYFATAFGYEVQEVEKWQLQAARHTLLDQALKACRAPTRERDGFRRSASDILQMGLGDTQWPLNEIDLWDYAATIAALFKSGVARAVLEDRIPTVDAMRWRFLSVRFDGLSYLNQVHRVTDLIGRRDTVTAGLDAAQELIETTFPLGNEVYRDENGAVFVVPGLEDKGSVLDLEDDERVPLTTLIERAFAEAPAETAPGTALAGELVPEIEVSHPVRGKQLKLGRYLQDTALPLSAAPGAMADWWTGDDNREICTVCGVRPMGWGIDDLYPGRVEYYQRQFKQRKICGVCMKRRGRRAEEWAKRAERTIWIDEVSDANGRFALIVGRFGLAGWLDGSLIATMQKEPSFARINRCWRTTREFWEEVERETMPQIVSRWTRENGTYHRKWPRLSIKVKNGRALRKSLGSYHTYETEIDGRRVSLVWNPEQGDFISAENLRYLGRQLGLEGAPWSGSEDAYLLHLLKNRIEQASPMPIHEPSEYDKPTRPLEGVEIEVDYVDVDAPRYAPHIPLLTEPALFMILVPADRAMNVISAIKEKYEREMSKVRDRLPIHLGAIIARRRTPLRAVLEAGQAMLGRETRWEMWQVEAEPTAKTEDDAAVYLAQGNHHFQEWLAVPLTQGERHIRLTIGAKMGDGETDDIWYPHLLTREPEEEDDFDDEPWQHATTLEADDQVWIAPSAFDFEFLDTTGRRFEIAYDEAGRRRGRPTRPFLLEEVDRLEEIWGLLGQHLETTQWMALDGLIEQKRQEWGESAEKGWSQPFEKFVVDCLRNADWKAGWTALGEDREVLEEAALSGMLHDTIDLYHEATKQKPEKGA